jgi:hypothetical protein
MTTNQEAMDALMAKLYNIFAAKDTITNVPADSPFISFCRPGIPITATALDFGFATMTEDQLTYASDFADIANDIPSTAGFWNPSGRKVYNEYFKIIKSPKLPIGQLTESEKRELEEAKKFVFKDELRLDGTTGRMVYVEIETLIFERYKEYETRWKNQFDNYAKELGNYLDRRATDPMAASIWSRLEPILKQRVFNAMTAWEAAGKAIIEEKLALVSRLERRGSNQWWADRLRRFESHKNSDGVSNFLFTKYFPQKFWEQQNNGSWMTFTFNSKEVHTIDTSLNKSWGGGTSAGFGLWSWGGDYKRDTTDTYNESTIDTFALSVELARIPIRRTWMDAEVFTSRSWNFPDDTSQAEALSDGKNPPTGTMTSFPTALIVARNLKLRTDMSKEKNSYSLEQINGSYRAGWGPFSLKGNYSKTATRQTHDFSASGSGIECTGMQIIGYVCQTLPKCPNPDETLNWGNKP